MVLLSRLRVHPLFILAGLAVTVSACQTAPAPEAAKDNKEKPIAAAEKPSNPSPAEPPKPEPKKDEPPKFPRPKTVRGIYLTAWSAGRQSKMKQVVELIGKTEINSVVIDIRDSGIMYFKTGIELADKSGANQTAVVNPKKLMEFLAANKIYPIARIACFRDKFVPAKFPERAVQLPTGKPWKDRSGNTWLDPYQQRNWDYLAETVDFALDLGFPEIQLDYVRFPSEGKATTQRFPGKKTYADQKAKPEDVIASFAKFIGDKVRERGAEYSADIFGIISSGTADQGIGQSLEKIAAPFDLICPMVYPSHFARGEYGVANPDASPYAIVKKSLADYKRRLPNAKVRPWLQDFTLGVKYGKAEVQAQIKAAREIGYTEYLLWNASNRYTTSAILKPKTKPVAKP